MTDEEARKLADKVKKDLDEACNESKEYIKQLRDRIAKKVPETVDDDFDIQACSPGFKLPDCPKCVGDMYQCPETRFVDHTCDKSVSSTIGKRLKSYLTGDNKVVASGQGITITSIGITEEARAGLSAGTVAEGFTIGKTIEPGVVWPEFQQRLANLGSYSQFGLYEPSEADPMAAWLLSLRPTSFRERCWVGWRMWRDGVAKYPWPVRENKELRK